MAIITSFSVNTPSKSLNTWPRNAGRPIVALRVLVISASAGRPPSLLYLDADAQQTNIPSYRDEMCVTVEITTVPGLKQPALMIFRAPLFNGRAAALRLCSSYVSCSLCKVRKNLNAGIR